MKTNLSKFEFQSEYDAIKFAIEHSKQYHIPGSNSSCREIIKSASLIELYELIKTKKIKWVVEDITQKLEELLNYEIAQTAKQSIHNDPFEVIMPVEADSYTFPTAEIAIEFAESIIDNEYNLSLIPEEDRKQILSDATWYLCIDILDNKIRWTGGDIVDQFHFLVGRDLLFHIEEESKKKENK